MKRLIAQTSIVLLLAGGFVLLQGMPGASTVSECEAAGGSGCEGDQKVEEAGSFENDSIGSVCIKAGPDVFTFACGETDPSGCYDIEWTETSPGCCTAVVTGGGGTSRDCKEISHTAASFADPCEPPPPSPPPPSPPPATPSP